MKLAIGNADVPVGQYTQKIFKFYNIDETAVADKLTYGANVKEVTTAVSEGHRRLRHHLCLRRLLRQAHRRRHRHRRHVRSGHLPRRHSERLHESGRRRGLPEVSAGREASAEFEKVLFTPLSK